jgi:5-methylthioribose kinase
MKHLEVSSRPKAKQSRLLSHTSMHIQDFYTVHITVSYTNIQISNIYIKILKKTLHVSTFTGSSLCLGAEHVFNMDPYFEYDYITCNIMSGNKTLGITY